MLLKYRSRLIALLVAIVTLTVAIVSFAPLPIKSIEVQPEVQLLGNPLLEDGHQGHALNVWDLQSFDGKIYLAGGSTVSNSGPINVWAYSPNSQKFTKEYTVEEEAIEHYRVFDNQLYIPAADPIEGDQTKFYRFEVNGQWQKYASAVVELAHVRDLIKTRDKDILMVGNNRQPDRQSINGTAIATTTEDSLVFQSAGVENVESKGIVLVDYNWFFSIFKYQSQIFATNTLLRDADNYSGSTAVYDSESQQFQLKFDLRNDEFIPQNLITNSKYGIDLIYRLWNPIEFDNHLIYPVRSYSLSPQNYQQAYMNSIGFFDKSGMGSSPTEINLPQGALGEDVLLLNNELYVLANKKKLGNQFSIYVFKTDRWEREIKWQQVVEFDSSNKARSFEYLDGTFYFGLGQDYGEAIANSGAILSYSLP